MAEVGYKRVSTVSQKVDRQLVGIELDEVFEEKCSAKTVNRPEWQACLRYVRKGDTLHIHSLDRVCRSGASDAVKIVEELTSEGIAVVFHKEGMRFDREMTAIQRGMLAILASVAQMERELINERREEGMAAARAKGKHMGRPALTVTAEQIIEITDTGMSKEKAFKELGISRASGYRLLATHKGKES